MSVVARRIASVPRRTSVETWRRVVELVSATDSDARAELEGVTSVAAMLIADEQTKTAPITVSGGGPLVRGYTPHGDDASEDELACDPTAGDSWVLSLPATRPDVAAAETHLVNAPHVAVRDVDADDGERSSEASAKALVGDLVLDLEQLERP